MPARRLHGADCAELLFRLSAVALGHGSVKPYGSVVVEEPARIVGDLPRMTVWIEEHP